ncbi:MAG: hypothetical protein HYZ93_06185 [Candidatus Omnitrophica bacterium]|nr:hypothetical protein [Candidatus Omnitrophota bacterium]
MVLRLPALLLAIGLSLPSPALALRPESDRAGLEQALSPSPTAGGGLEEKPQGRKGINRRDFLRFGASPLTGVSPEQIQAAGLSGEELGRVAQLTRFYQRWVQKAQDSMHPSVPPARTADDRSELELADEDSLPASPDVGRLTLEQFAALRSWVNPLLARLGPEHPIARTVREQEHLFEKTLSTVQSQPKVPSFLLSEAQDMTVAYKEPERFPLWRRIRDLTWQLQNLVGIKNLSPLAEFQRAKRMGLRTAEAYDKDATARYLSPAITKAASNAVESLRKQGIRSDSRDAVEGYRKFVDEIFSDKWAYLKRNDSWKPNDYFDYWVMTRRLSVWESLEEKISAKLQRQFGDDLITTQFYTRHFNERGDEPPARAARRLYRTVFEASLRNRLQRKMHRALLAQREAGASISDGRHDQEIARIADMPFAQLQRINPDTYAAYARQQYPAQDPLEQLAKQLEQLRSLSALPRLTRRPVSRDPIARLADDLATAARAGRVEFRIHTGLGGSLRAVRWKNSGPRDIHRRPLLSREELARLQASGWSSRARPHVTYSLPIPAGTSAAAVEDFLRQEDWWSYPADLRSVVRITPRWPIVLPPPAAGPSAPPVPSSVEGLRSGLEEPMEEDLDQALAAARAGGAAGELALKQLRGWMIEPFTLTELPELDRWTQMQGFQGYLRAARNYIAVREGLNRRQDVALETARRLVERLTLPDSSISPSMRPIMNRFSEEWFKALRVWAASLRREIEQVDHQMGRAESLGREFGGRSSQAKEHLEAVVEETHQGHQEATRLVGQVNKLSLEGIATLFLMGQMRSLLKGYDVAVRVERFTSHGFAQDPRWRDQVPRLGIDLAKVGSVLVVRAAAPSDSPTPPAWTVHGYVHGEYPVQEALERRVRESPVEGISFEFGTLPPESLRPALDEPGLVFRQGGHTLHREVPATLATVDLPAGREAAEAEIAGFSPAAMAAVAFDPALLPAIASLNVQVRTFKDSEGLWVLAFFV